MKLKLLRDNSFDDFYGTYFNSMPLREVTHAVLRFDLPLRNKNRLFYIGALENRKYGELNIELKRIL